MLAAIRTGAESGREGVDADGLVVVADTGLGFIMDMVIAGGGELRYKRGTIKRFNEP